MSGESRFKIAAGRRVRLRLLVCAPIAVVFAVVAVAVTLFMGVASTAAAESGGGVFGSPVAPGVSASFVSVGDPSFGEQGEGAGQIGSPHIAASGYHEVVGGMTIDHVTGDVYVADAVNRRIDEFTEGGTFVRAWGWGVDKANPELKLQECTVATGCQKGEAGGGAGELSEPVGIAIDGEAGSEAVYVLESGISGGNDRVQEFTPAGVFVTMWGGKVNKKGGSVCAEAEASECQRGSEGSGGGEFDDVGLQGAIAVGPNGSVYVGDYRRVQRFNSSGIIEGSFPVVTESQVEALAVTSGGEVCLTVNPFSDYTQESPVAEVRCYSSAAGVLLHTVVLEEQPVQSTAEASIWLAADGDGHLFVDEYQLVNAEGLTVQAVFEYGEAGQELGRFLPPGGEADRRERKPGGFALSESAGVASTLVVSRREAVVRSEALPPPGPVVIGVEGVPGEPSSSAALRASIDPEGHSSEYLFFYGTEVSSETATGPSVKMTAEGFKPEKVEAKLSGLKAGTLYHFHVVAKNNEGDEVVGADQTFTTLPALRVDTVAANEVSAEGAKLEADLNTLGSPSEYWFEYAAAGEEEQHTEAFLVAAGKEEVTVSAHAQGLRPDTVYAYRIMAKNALGEAPCSGQCEGRLLTQRAGTPFALLDGRAWEQVSPPGKGVADISLFAGAAGPLRAAPNGEAIAYMSRGGSEVEPEGEPLYTHNVSRRGTKGWVTRDIAPPNAQRYTFEIARLGQYLLFSEDLRRSVLASSPYTALSQWTTEPVEYLREEAKCPQGVVSLTQIQASECFIPLLTDRGPFADVKEGVRFGAIGGESTGAVTVREATPDLSHMVLLEGGESATPELVAGAAAQGLYEWSAGRELALLSLTSQGTACEAGGGINALSPNGQIALWSGKGAGCNGHLYLRNDTMEPQSAVSAGRCVEPEGACTVQLDEVQSGSGVGTPDAYYQDASVGDEHIFFTDSQHLTEGSTGFQTPNAGQERADLYEYSFDRASDTGSLVDMTKPVAVGEAAGVLGVAGISDDGSVVYAIATGVLSAEANPRGEHAVSGEPNLYKLERAGGVWKATFITALSATDQPDWGLKGDSTADNEHEVEQAGQRTTRVSSDGEWLAFMSDRSLTGYDNEDVTSKTPGERMDEEVFLYDANDNRVVCASCNPTGARPTGIEIPGEGHTVPLIASEREWEVGRWLSGVLPVPYGGTAGVRQPRYLSNGGRLFFNSTDGLVPSDRNGVADAYEYESPASGETVADGANDTCTSGSVTYSRAGEGCIDLISSGTSPEESVFIEASENGNDVFFLTSERLTLSDTDSAYDVYDAHVCGWQWECPEPSAVSPPCTGTESCRGAPAPQSAVYGAAGTATFSGPGNPSPTDQATGTTKKTMSKKVVRCAKGRRRVQGKCVNAKVRRRARHARRARAERIGDRGRGR